MSIHVLPPHMIPGTTSLNLGDGRHIIIGKAIDLTVRIRQQIAGSAVSIFDHRQPQLINRLRGDGNLIDIHADNLSPLPGRTWVITYVAMSGEGSIGDRGPSAHR